METHHQKSHRPKIPDAASLNAIANAKLGQWAVIKDLEDSEDNEDNKESDIEEEERGHHQAKCHSKGTKKREFTQLQNYLAMWKKALDSAKKIAHRDGFLEGAFNSQMIGLQCAGDSLAEAMADHEQDSGRVEKGKDILVCYCCHTHLGLQDNFLDMRMRCIFW